MNNPIEELETVVSDFMGKIDKISKQIKAKCGESNNPPITGRPFMKGVNEPEKEQIVWYMSWAGKPERFMYYDNSTMGLSLGMLYPTEADCREGNRREEIRKRYEAMGRAYKEGEHNWCAKKLNQSVDVVTTLTNNIAGVVYFATESDCQSAISAINAEYGPGAFEWACLGVKGNG